MALQFNPGTYFNAYQIGEQNRLKNEQKPFQFFENLATASGGIADKLMQIKDAKRKADLEQQLLDEKRRQWNILQYGFDPSEIKTETEGYYENIPTSGLLTPQSYEGPLDAPMRNIMQKPQIGIGSDFQVWRTRKKTKLPYDPNDPSTWGGLTIKKQEQLQSMFGKGLKGIGGGVDASDLRKEFNQNKTIQDYKSIRTKVSQMDAVLSNLSSSSNKNNLAVDQALITIYNKILDPTSVVRESEYARTPENLPKINQIIGAMEKWKSGGAGLTQEDRQSLVLASKIIANELAKSGQDVASYYSELASRQKLDPYEVIGDSASYGGFDVSGMMKHIPNGRPIGGSGVNNDPLGIR